MPAPSNNSKVSKLRLPVMLLRLPGPAARSLRFRGVQFARSTFQLVTARRGRKSASGGTRCCVRSRRRSSIGG